MKKLYTLCLSAFLGVSAFAQTQADRVIVHEKGGSFKGFLAERVDSISFPKLEGRVAADLKILEVKKDTVMVTIKRTPECVAFKLMSVPEVVANRLTDDAAMASYVDQALSDQYMYYQDFEQGLLTDPSWEPDVNYVLTSVAYDRYRIPCSVVRVPFSTPKNPLVGDPKVKATVEDLTARSFAYIFSPNKDVAGFAVLAAPEGTIQDQYEMFAPMMGFKNFSQMIQAWGFQGETEEVGFEWKDMEPNTMHDIFVQAWDVNGTFADCDTLKVQTKMLGGEGVAAVDVKLGDYQLAAWGEEMLPSQTVSFTPNDQTSCYRFNVALASEFDKDPEGYKNELPQEPPFPMSNWFFYEALTTDYQINPNVEFVVLTAAKNGPGVWSEVDVKRFTTPEKIPGTESVAPMAPQAKIAKRVLKSNTINYQPGKMPNFYKNVKPSRMTLK